VTSDGRFELRLPQDKKLAYIATFGDQISIVRLDTINFECLNPYSDNWNAQPTVPNIRIDPSQVYTGPTQLAIGAECRLKAVIEPLARAFSQMMCGFIIRKMGVS
jgi:hypothetical protein